MRFNKLSGIAYALLFSIACWTLFGILVVLSACSTTPRDNDDYELRAWTNLSSSAASVVTANHRLIGFACGPKRLTMTAPEEDWFPSCEAIEAINDVCPVTEQMYPDEPIEPWECARYWGDGW